MCTLFQIQSLVPDVISHVSVTTRQTVSLVSPGPSQEKDIPTPNDYIRVSQSALVPTEVIEMRTRTSSPHSSTERASDVTAKVVPADPLFLARYNSAILQSSSAAVGRGGVER